MDFASSSTTTQQPEFSSEPIEAWESRAPWYRRFSARLGLQGKLVTTFMLLLSAGLGTASLMFTSETSETISDLMGEQARQLSTSLALGSRSALCTGNAGELSRMGQDLIKSRNILFVAFLDSEARPIALASRDLDFKWDQVLDSRQGLQELMQVRREQSVLFGEYLQVVAPVLGAGAPNENSNLATSTRLLGYVAVGMSQAKEQAQLGRINIKAFGIGVGIVMTGLPLAYALVHRIFLPIRQLVDATNKIAGGELDSQVALHRPDMIGTLARSFNEMVQRVKRQQDDLASANEKLALANHDLEEKVQQRTVQLEAANKRLSSEIAEKEDFLRAVSHDLNAPLRNISGMATMLLMKNREKFDEDVIHRLERIQKNVEVETDLISELLELSRIKTRRQKMEDVDLGVLIKEIGEVFENDLRSKGIALLVDTPLPTLSCERARLRQVFQNLIDNAIKYMGEDPPKKEIHVGCRVKPSEAEFYVSDTGIGIDPEDIDKVFFIFRRGKNTANTSVAGKGVGLASVKSIIETYSGTIWVESQVGHGSTFRFTINGQYVGSRGADAHPVEDEAQVQFAGELVETH